MTMEKRTANDQRGESDTERGWRSDNDTDVLLAVDQHIRRSPVLVPGGSQSGYVLVESMKPPIGNGRKKEQLRIY